MEFGEYLSSKQLLPGEVIQAKSLLRSTLLMLPTSYFEGACIGISMLCYSMTDTGFPSTPILGLVPSPGRVLAAMRPLTRRGAPSAVFTVT